MSSHLDLPSFPTRRSSDLALAGGIFHRESRRHAIAFRGGDGPRSTRRSVGRVGTAKHLLRCKRAMAGTVGEPARVGRSEEHTSELQSLRHLVCRLLLEKKK